VLIALLQATVDSTRGTTGTSLPCLARIPHDSLPSLVQLACGPGTPAAVALVTAGNALWILVYILIIVAASKARTFGVPVLAIALNFTWELYFAVWQPQATLALRAVNWTWLLLDAVIVYQLAHFGREQVRPELRKHFNLLLGALLGIALAGHATFHGWFTHLQIFPDSGSAISGMFINLIMSVLFVFLALDRPDSRGLSYSAAWAKCIATALITAGLAIQYSSRAAGEWIFSAHHEGSAQAIDLGARGMATYDPSFVYYMGAVIFLFDVTYIVILHRRRVATSAAARLPGGEAAPA
jgi:hypothetical protein